MSHRRSGRTGWMLLLAAALLAARPAAGQESAGYAAPGALAVRADPRLWTGAGWSEDAARPILSLRGMAIGGTVGCAVGAAAALLKGSGLSGDVAAAHAVAWCLFFWLPGTIFGGLFIDD